MLPLLTGVMYNTVPYLRNHSKVNPRRIEYKGKGRIIIYNTCFADSTPLLHLNKKYLSDVQIPPIQ